MTNEFRKAKIKKLARQLRWHLIELAMTGTKLDACDACLISHEVMANMFECQIIIQRRIIFDGTPITSTRKVTNESIR